MDFPRTKISLWGLRAFIPHRGSATQVTQVTPCPNGRGSVALRIPERPSEKSLPHTGETVTGDTLSLSRCRDGIVSVSGLDGQIGMCHSHLDRAIGRRGRSLGPDGSVAERVLVASFAHGFGVGFFNGVAGEFGVG